MIPVVNGRVEARIGTSDDAPHFLQHLEISHAVKFPFTVLAFGDSHELSCR